MNPDSHRLCEDWYTDIIVLILLYDLNIVGKVLTYNTKIRQNIYTWML